MAALTELQESGPAGDFYAWVLKRYQRVIFRLVLLLILLIVGLGVLGFWFASRLSVLEGQQAPSRTVVHGPTLDEWQSFQETSAARDVALERKVTAMTQCLNGNLKAFDAALSKLLVGKLAAREFVSGFKLRSCG